MEDIKFKAQMMGMSPRLIKKTDPRRLQELLDSRMIQEDEHAIANCSPRFIHKQFHHSYVNPYDDNDAIRPVPPRYRRYVGREDISAHEAEAQEESYGAPVRSEW